MSREKFFVWSTFLVQFQSFSFFSLFFGNNRRSFSFSTCLNINLIFHYLNWFHLNEIFLLLLHSWEAFVCAFFFCFCWSLFQSIAKEFFCWAVIYLFEVLCLLSHSPNSYISLNSLVSFNAIAKLFYVLSIRA